MHYISDYHVHAPLTKAIFLFWVFPDWLKIAVKKVEGGTFRNLIMLTWRTFHSNWIGISLKWLTFRVGALSFVFPPFWQRSNRYCGVCAFWPHEHGYLFLVWKGQGCIRNRPSTKQSEIDWILYASWFMILGVLGISLLMNMAIFSLKMPRMHNRPSTKRSWNRLDIYGCLTDSVVSGVDSIISVLSEARFTIGSKH